MATVYDRRGRRVSVTTSTNTSTYTYNSSGQLLTESFPLAGITITNTYDNLLRREWLLVGTAGPAVRFGYDAASRLQTVTAGSHSAAYSYLANSPLVSTIVFGRGTNTVMSTSKSYDNLGRLGAIKTSAGVWSVASHSYIYNSANQRTARLEADNFYWQYSYDSLGQVTSGKKYWSDNTPVAGQQFEYEFDDIGNRITSAVNGRESTYTANSLNQYTQRTVPGAIDVLGVAKSNAVVRVNGLTTQRKGEYFYRELTVTNEVGPWCGLYPEVVVRAALADSESSATGHVFVANTPEVFQHDADGNLTRDGRWVYTWDGENRLVSMETRSCLLYPEGSGVPGRKLEFMYDHMGRRARKRVYTWNGSGWTPGTETLFVYDGWNLVCELSAVSNQLSATRSYVWGLDLSGTEQGAGGVGGSLFIGNRSSVIGHYAAAYDGNGNVMALVDMAGAGLAAAYEYGPFGELIRSTGPMSESNPFRFSTKYQDEETGLLYYGYRYYQPVTGRWLSRDPMEGDGGLNLYGVVGNNGINLTDPFGLWQWPWKGCCDGKEYNRFKDCCCSKGQVVRNGGAGCKLVSKTKTKTGIRRCCQYGRIIYGIDWPQHCWVEWPAPPGHGSAGYYPGSVVHSPDDYSGTSRPPNPKCDEVEVSLCDYDLDKFKQCLADAGAGNHGLPAYNVPSYDCRHWSRDIIARCKEKSKDGCTMPK